mgnify:CR=1 FL=1
MADYTTLSKTNFKVEIDGIDYGNFLSVQGLGGTAQVMDDVGGMDKNAKKVPGNIKYEIVTLTRNCDPTDAVLRDWWKTVERGTPERKAVSVVLFGRDGVTEVARRNMYECLPCGWDISDLGTDQDGVLTELIQLVYEDGDWA